MSSGAIKAMTMRNRRREVIATIPSFIPGMFGWTAVHVHANKVKAQLKIISHKVLVLQLDGEALTSRMGIVVPLQPGSEARHNGMHNERALRRSVIERSRGRNSVGIRSLYPSL